MQPFGLLPDYPQWERRPLDGASKLQNLEVEVVGGHLVQRIDNVLVTTRVRPSHGRSPGPDLALDMPAAADPPGEPLDVNALWTTDRSNSIIKLNLSPTLDPNRFASKYEETVLNQGPLALFPKQVLAKMSAVPDASTYIDCILPFLLSPADLDAKYKFDGRSEATPFITKVRSLEDDMRPLSTVLQELKVRETQLQVILGLEVLAHTAQPDPALDRHFDRLCIWQAVSGNPAIVSDFCSTVLLPYFRSKAPKKVKQLMSINRGTLKSRSRRSKPAQASRSLTMSPSYSSFSSDHTAPVASAPLSGLAKALHMRNLASPVEPETSASPVSAEHAPKRRRVPLEFSAYRRTSHPVYKQQSLHSHLEVDFTSRRRVSKHRPKPAKQASAARAHPMDTEPASAPSTPTEPTPSTVPPLPDDLENDIISSTDSDSG